MGSGQGWERCRRQERVEKGQRQHKEQARSGGEEDGGAEKGGKRKETVGTMHNSGKTKGTNK